MAELDSLLREKVRLLGQLLGKTIEADCGQDVFERIESIRHHSKAAHQGEASDREALISLLKSVSDHELVPVIRGFNQFLNLSNIAEQQHAVSWRRDTKSLDEVEQVFESVLSRLEKHNIGHDEVARQLAEMNIELVLTAHPTEVTRRTLIQKYDAVTDILNALDDLRDDHPQRERIEENLASLISEIWRSDEIRQQRPTAVDEARWGFAVVENSLWSAVPELLRHVDNQLKAAGADPLPLDAAPVRFASWMGGDRDGNPNVTSEVTMEVMYLARWMAADLYHRDIKELASSLSITQASDELREWLGGDCAEPYRECLNRIRKQLEQTKVWAAECARTRSGSTLPHILDNKTILEPLLICYRSLCGLGMEDIANQSLLDVIRRVSCFGLTLMRLDVRQESSRHAEVIAELCEYYELGDYLSWSEEEKQKFLLEELASKRPLLPRQAKQCVIGAGGQQGSYWIPGDNAAEVLRTMTVIAEHGEDSISNYIISMASEPSDILAVALLMQSAGVGRNLPIVPLFETLDDLAQASERMDKLFSVPWYHEYCQGHQQVMIGYSDSAKDAGNMAAAWAQYKTQEELVECAARHGLKLTLFHGRGGTVGRGGGPAQRAIIAQPPGSVNGGFRVTEQGEMIRFKFGTPSIAARSLKIYLAAVLEATLMPPTAPEKEWRDVMEQLGKSSVASYRRMVRENKDFVPYFRSATPEQELGKLSLGSRPARRKAEGGIESLRAIPWIFAWMQMRLMVPAWLGADEALNETLKNQRDLLGQMYREWPFFNTYIDMLEMIVAKTDRNIALHYEELLVAPEHRPIGTEIRSRLSGLEQTILTLKGQTSLMEHAPVFAQSLAVRATYTDPLHYLQAELLKRNRENGEAEAVAKALQVTMAGIAAGMRNTG